MIQKEWNLLTVNIVDRTDTGKLKLLQGGAGEYVGDLGDVILNLLEFSGLWRTFHGLPETKRPAESSISIGAMSGVSMLLPISVFVDFRRSISQGATNLWRGGPTFTSESRFTV